MSPLAAVRVWTPTPTTLAFVTLIRKIPVRVKCPKGEASPSLSPTAVTNGNATGAAIVMVPLNGAGASAIAARGWANSARAARVRPIPANRCLMIRSFLLGVAWVQVDRRRAAAHGFLHFNVPAGALLLLFLLYAVDRTSGVTRKSGKASSNKELSDECISSRANP